MPRRYTRSGRYTRRVKTVKYSNETYNFIDSLPVTKPSSKTIAWSTVISAIDQQGVRKCKNFELTLTGGPLYSGTPNTPVETVPLFWALVYVPQGTQPSDINVGSTEAPASLYEPNQNVIMSGVWPGDLTAPYVKRTRLARNLNSGDSLAFVIAVPPFKADDTVTYSKNIAMTLNYAISF